MTRMIFIGMIALGILVCGCTESGPSPDARSTPSAAPAAAEVTDALVPSECGTIARLHTFDGIFLASQPSPDDFEQARDEGMRTVVNLRHSEEIEGFDEARIARDLGLAYHNPAWNGPDELTDAIFDELRGLLADAERPLLLHCGSANRVGAIWMAYRVLDDGLDVDEAVAEAEIVGLNSPAYEEKARDYIRRRRDS